MTDDNDDNDDDGNRKISQITAPYLPILLLIGNFYRYQIISLIK